MKQHPKQLALLISLIGTGVAPYACASQYLPLAALPSWGPATVLEAAAPTARSSDRWAMRLGSQTEGIVLGGEPPQIGWRATRTLDLPRALKDVPHQLPVRMPGAESGKVAKSVGTSQAKSVIKRPQATKRLSSKATRPSLTGEVNPDARGRAGPAPVPATFSDADKPKSQALNDALASAEDRTPDQRSEPLKPDHERDLLRDLAAIVLDDLSDLNDLSAEVSLAPDAAPPLAKQQTQAANPADPVGAQRFEARDPGATTQAEAVLSTLDKLATARVVIELPPAAAELAMTGLGIGLGTGLDLNLSLGELDLNLDLQHERSLETRAQAHVEPSAGLDLDLTRPFTPAQVVAAALGPTADLSREAMGLDLDLTLPLGAEQSVAANPVAGVASKAMVVDIDLSVPLSLEQMMASWTKVQIEEATLAAEPTVTAVVSVAKPPELAALAPSRDRLAHRSPFGSTQVAVSEVSLDGVRGGFLTDGMNISFGIERAIYVNGTLVTTTSLNVSDLGRITAGRGTGVFDTGTIALIQSGAGNTVSSGTFSTTSMGTVIQNTLDGQKIQSATVINATVNSLGLLNGLNLQSSMRGALIDSLRR